VGLPPLLVILRDNYRPQVFESSILSSSGGKPTFPTCYCAEVRQRPICSGIFKHSRQRWEFTAAMRKCDEHLRDLTKVMRTMQDRLV